MTPAKDHPIIATIRAEIDDAANRILDAAEACLAGLAAARRGETAALTGIDAELTRIMEACAFQDIVGQRLSQLVAAPGYGAPSVSAGAGLLNGPAPPGEGLNQTGIDALMQPSGQAATRIG